MGKLVLYFIGQSTILGTWMVGGMISSKAKVDCKVEATIQFSSEANIMIMNRS